jgi:hypothetical protein
MWNVDGSSEGPTDPWTGVPVGAVAGAVAVAVAATAVSFGAGFVAGVAGWWLAAVVFAGWLALGADDVQARTSTCTAATPSMRVTMVFIMLWTVAH